MFELEILELLNSYKNADEYDKNKIESSMKKLISEHKQEFQKFLDNSQIDNEAKDFLLTLSKEEKTTDEKDDFKVIKEMFMRWEIEFEKNRGVPSKKNEEIILEIINFYVKNRFYVLERILEIEDSTNYESFKNMLKNYLRRYFCELIENYYESEKFKSLGYLKKRKKKNQILRALDKVGEYKFKPKEIEEAIN